MVYGQGVPRQALPVTLLGTERQELQRWVSAHHTPQQVSQRCQIILAAADEKQDKAIAADLGINFKTVALGRGRFCEGRGAGFWAGSPGRGSYHPVHEQRTESIIVQATPPPPADPPHRYLPPH